MTTAVDMEYSTSFVTPKIPTNREMVSFFSNDRQTTSIDINRFGIHNVQL